MDQRGPVRYRWIFAIGLLYAALLLAGCASFRPGALRASADDAGALTAAGVDAGAGGMRMTVTELLPVEGRGLQAYGASASRVQTYVSLADAVWQWERKGAPQLVVIGEAWIRMHGFASSWANQMARLGFKDGRRPLVAVTEGSAGELIRSGPAARNSAAQLGQADWTANPLRARSVSYEEDLVLPYLAKPREPGEAPAVSVQAMLFKKGQLAGTLTPQQSGWLACLRGDARLPELAWPAAPGVNAAYRLEQASCRTDVRGNGSLSHPRLAIDVAVRGRIVDPGPADREPMERAKRALQASLTGLVRTLQERRIDPLHLGDSFRSQYAGLWSPDRWRTALAGADVELSVKLNLTEGGANP